MQSKPEGDSARLLPSDQTEIEDELLASLNAGVRGNPGIQELEEYRGADEAEATADRPFDLEIAKPRVIDVGRLYGLARRPIPDDIKAALGPSRPLLVCHAVTPFHQAGRRVSAVWGLGYEARLVGVDGDTVAFTPGSMEVVIGDVQQTISLGLGFGGELSLPDEAIELGNTVPGVHIEGGALRFSTDSRFAIAISLKLALRAVQAGPVGAGGVRWNLYRQESRLDEQQALFQTLLIPRTAEALGLEVRSWVRTKGFLGIGATQWSTPWHRFDCPLARL